MNAITVNNLPQISHENMPVITTELLAKLYNVKPKNININFANNKERFIEGKHYFKLTGSLLKAFKNKVDEIYSQNLQPKDIGSQNKGLYTDNIGLQISSKVRSLILWTERGSARHAKMITSDEAWEVFEKLEDNYFSVTKRTTATQRKILINACDKLALNNGLRSDIYTSVANRFGYDKPVNMPIDILPEAIEYVYEELLAQEKARKANNINHEMVEVLQDMEKLYNYTTDTAVSLIRSLNGINAKYQLSAE